MRRFVVLAAVGAAVCASSALAGSRGGSTTVVDYGGSVTLKATVPGGVEGPKVSIVGKSCAFTAFATLARPGVPPSGAVAYTVGPAMNTVYKVLAGGRPVTTLTVRVRPAIELKRSGGHIQVTVTTGNGNGLGGRRVAIQQQTSSGGWKTVGTVRLKLTSRVDQIDAVATGTGVVQGTSKVRAVLSAVQAKPCFAPATSPAA
ncbi:MAG: hypothetical protein ACRDL2_13010 [Gaiellaceae bacterium]